MPIAQPFPRARLADHVRACRVGDRMIFLDMLRSKYIGVGGPQLPALSAAMSIRWSADDTAVAPVQPAVLDEWLHCLDKQRLLSNAPSSEPVRQQPMLLEAVAGLSADDEDLAAGSEWPNLVRLWRATIVTAAWLRWRNLVDIANRVEALRTRHGRRGEGFAADTTRASAASYLRLRPFALTSQDRCLYDSLALVHFLATQGQFAQWVIGVRLNPFAAHSWVQSGGVVLNDQPERVRRYQPILIV